MKNRRPQPQDERTMPGTQRWQQPSSRSYVPPQRPKSQNNWVWVIIAVTLLGATLVVTLALIVALRTTENDDGNQQNTAMAAIPQTEPTSIVHNTPDVAEEATEVRGAIDNSLVIEPWDGEERFTVLVMGMDNRPGQPSGICRTDTMMIISLDPINDRIGIMSIPRDTYVQVWGYADLRRINEACVLGNLQSPGNGPRLAMQTVQYNFGIRINDYLLIDFNTFIRIIDRIGGVDVYVERPINDPLYPDMFYGYDPFSIDAGWQHLDGATALKYARSRHGSDDIDRGRRQQQVIFAVRDKILSRDMIDDLIADALPLWNDLSEGIDTGLSLDQLITLALFAKDIPDSNIHNAVLGWEYMMPYQTPTGASVLVPDRWKIGPLMVEVFGEGYNR